MTAAARGVTRSWVQSNVPCPRRRCAGDEPGACTLQRQRRRSGTSRRWSGRRQRRKGGFATRQSHSQGQSAGLPGGWARPKGPSGHSAATRARPWPRPRAAAGNLRKSRPPGARRRGGDPLQVQKHITLVTTAGTGTGVAHGHVPQRQDASTGVKAAGLAAKFVPPGPSGLARGAAAGPGRRPRRARARSAGHGKTTRWARSRRRSPAPSWCTGWTPASRDPARSPHGSAARSRHGRPGGRLPVARRRRRRARRLKPRPGARPRRLPRGGGVGGRAGHGPDHRARPAELAGGARRAPGRRAGRAGAAGVRRRARRRRRRPAVPVLGGGAAVPRGLPEAAGARGRRARSQRTEGWAAGSRCSSCSPRAAGRAAAAAMGDLSRGSRLVRSYLVREVLGDLPRRAARVPAPDQRPGRADRRAVRRAAGADGQPGRAGGAGQRRLFTTAANDGRQVRYPRCCSAPRLELTETWGRAASREWYGRAAELLLDAARSPRRSAPTCGPRTEGRRAAAASPRRGGRRRSAGALESMLPPGRVSATRGCCSHARAGSPRRVR